MKKNYEVFMNESGNPHGSGIRFTVQAESETEAKQIAMKRYPNKVIASLKQKWFLWGK